MDMWHWLADCHRANELNVNEMHEILENHEKAYELFKEFIHSMEDQEISEWVTEQIKGYLEFLEE